jgi:hypothetical protein
MRNRLIKGLLIGIWIVIWGIGSLGVQGELLSISKSKENFFPDTLRIFRSSSTPTLGLYTYLSPDLFLSVICFPLSLISSDSQITLPSDSSTWHDSPISEADILLLQIDSFQTTGTTDELSEELTAEIEESEHRFEYILKDNLLFYTVNKNIGFCAYLQIDDDEEEEEFEWKCEQSEVHELIEREDYSENDVYNIQLIWENDQGFLLILNPDIEYQTAELFTIRVYFDNDLPQFENNTELQIPELFCEQIRIFVTDLCDKGEGVEYCVNLFCLFTEIEMVYRYRAAVNDTTIEYTYDYFFSSYSSYTRPKCNKPLMIYDPPFAVEKCELDSDKYELKVYSGDLRYEYGNSIGTYGFNNFNMEHIEFEEYSLYAVDDYYTSHAELTKTFLVLLKKESIIIPPYLTEIDLDSKYMVDSTSGGLFLQKEYEVGEEETVIAVHIQDGNNLDTSILCPLNSIYNPLDYTCMACDSNSFSLNPQQIDSCNDCLEVSLFSYNAHVGSRNL